MQSRHQTTHPASLISSTKPALGAAGCYTHGIFDILPHVCALGHSLAPMGRRDTKINAPSACGQHPENACLSGCGQRAANMHLQNQPHRPWRVLSHAPSIHTHNLTACRLYSRHQPTHRCTLVVCETAICMHKTPLPYSSRARGWRLRYCSSLLARGRFEKISSRPSI